MQYQLSLAHIHVSCLVNRGLDGMVLPSLNHILQGEDDARHTSGSRHFSSLTPTITLCCCHPRGVLGTHSVSCVLRGATRLSSSLVQPLGLLFITRYVRAVPRLASVRTSRICDVLGKPGRAYDAQTMSSRRSVSPSRPTFSHCQDCCPRCGSRRPRHPSALSRDGWPGQCPR